MGREWTRMGVMEAAKEAQVLTVSELTRRVKDLLEGEVGYVWVSGEISNWRVSPSGHAYFTLKDAHSQVESVMFRNRLFPLRFQPGNGLEVVVYGLVTVYEKRGSYQIVCEEMHPKGVGALQLAFEQLKRKLEAEGLFDAAHKKPLPLLPHRIGIVTSPTGAAIRDILNVIRRRFAHVHLILYPARVQGEEAAAEIVEGIRTLDRWGVDVIIVGRGGGSLEDLWPFNEESVVRAVYAAKTPIISAVGHEIDYVLTDFAADVRAPTPSAAAEIVVREQEVLVDRIGQLRKRLAKGAAHHLEQAHNRLALAKSSYVFRRPEELVRQRRLALDDLRMRLDGEMTRLIELASNRLRAVARALALLSPKQRLCRAREQLGELRRRAARAGRTLLDRYRAQVGPLMARLTALNPLAVLARGYAAAWKLPQKVLVRDARQLAPEDRLLLKFGHGGATATVETVEGDSNG